MPQAPDRTAEFSDEELRRAATVIVDEYLLCGMPYPQFSSDAVTAGDVLIALLEADDLEAALSALACGARDAVQYQTTFLGNVLQQEGPHWLVEHRPDVVHQMAWALREPGDD